MFQREPENAESVIGLSIEREDVLQTDTALSTMKAESEAILMAMRELIPLKDGVQEVSSSIGLKLQEYTEMKNTIWEDNAGTLTLAKLEPPR